MSVGAGNAEVIVALAGLAVIIYVFNIRPIEASAASIAAFDTCSKNDPNIVLFQRALDTKATMADQDIQERLLSCALNVISNPSVSEETKRDFLDLAIRGNEDEIASAPADARPYALGGAFLDQVGDFIRAAPLLETAHALMPAKETISFELAINYLQQDKKDQALALLKRVYESAPGYGKAQSAYAVGLVIVGEDAQASQIFGADQSAISSAQAYMSSGQYSKAMDLIQSIVASQQNDVSARIQQAQILYSSGMVSEAIQTMRSIENDHPELTGQIEAAIREVQNR